MAAQVQPSHLKEAAATYLAPPSGLSLELAPVIEKWSRKLSPEALASALAAIFRDSVDTRSASLPAATLRGLAAREHLKAEEGGHVSADEARRFLNNVSKTTVLAHYHAGKLLAWKEGRAFRFPVWQFTPEGGLLPGILEILNILHRSPILDDWGKILFFLNPRNSLSGKRPLDHLRAGNTAPILRLAEGELE